LDLVTAGSVVRQAAVQSGLAGPAGYADGTALTDPFSSADVNIIRMCSLLGSLGQEIRAGRQWSTLRQGYVFNTVAGNGLYPLPPDYDRLVDQTGWNRTNRLPLGGPISAQDRAVLKALLVNVTFTVLFDILDGQFASYPDNTVLPGGQVLAYNYQSLWWTQPAIPAYANGTTYTAGQIVIGGLKNGVQTYYYCQVGGTVSSVGGPGRNLGQPIVTPGLIPDAGGVVQWLYCPAYANNTPYITAPGANFSLAIINGSLYFCSLAGTSAAVGTGPIERGIGVPDGVLGVAGAPLWTWAAGITVPTTGAPSLSTDILWFDQPYLVSALKRKWRVENGWPISDDMKRDFEAAKQGAETADAVGKMLSLDKRASGTPLIGSQNVPFTGFGGP
jgi:hypothetical protein